MVPTTTDWSLHVGNGQFGAVEYSDCTGVTFTKFFIHGPVATLPLSFSGIFAATFIVLVLICAYYRFNRRRTLHHDATR